MKNKEQILKELGMKNMPFSFRIGMYMGVVISLLLATMIALGLIAGIIYLIKYLGGVM